MNNSDSLLRVMSNVTKIQLNGFNDRLCLQKLGFLIQKIQQDETYNFSWYIRGPYSSTLTSLLFRHKELGTYENPPELSESELSVKEKIHILLGKNTKDPFYLELYASLWYLMSGHLISIKEKEEIISIMYQDKPYFSRKDVISALAKISKFRTKYSL